jgi:hypothetical protein
VACPLIEEPSTPHALSAHLFNLTNFGIILSPILATPFVQTPTISWRLPRFQFPLSSAAFRFVGFTSWNVVDVFVASLMISNDDEAFFI